MFEKIIGHAKALRLLAADMESGRVAETYLFTGMGGVGKKTVALEMAKALNCKNGRPCGACASCRKIEGNVHPDVFVLNLESQAELLQLKEDEAMRQKELKIEALR